MTVAQFAEIKVLGFVRYRANEISGIRSQQHNGSIPDAHPDSLHMMGLASDAWFHEIGEMIACARFFLRAGLWVKRNGELTIHVQALVPKGSSIAWQLDQIDSWATDLGPTRPA